MRFRLFSESELRCANESAGVVLESWQPHWFLKGAQHHITSTVSPAATIRDSDELLWYRLGSKDAPYIGGTPRVINLFGSALLDVDPDNDSSNLDAEPSNLAVWLTCEVAHNFVERLIPGLLEPCATVPPPDPSASRQFSHAYNGQLRIQLCFESHPEAPLNVMLSAQHAEAWLHRISEPRPTRPRAALTARMKAVEPALIKLCVDLSGEALSISDVQELHPGDIVSLRRSIHKPLTIQTESGQPLGSCYLGRIQANRGVKLAKAIEEKRNG